MDWCGDELWVTDGTTEGTQLLADIRSNNSEDYYYSYSSVAEDFTVAGRTFVFYC